MFLPSYATECIQYDPSEQIENTPVIITGNLTSSQVTNGQEIAIFQILTKWKGKNISKGDVVNVKLTDTTIDSISKDSQYLIFAEYDTSNDLIQSRCEGSIVLLSDSGGAVHTMLERNMPSQDPPEIMEVRIDNIKSLGYDIGDTIKISVKISNQIIPKEIKLVFKNSEHNIIHEETITTDSYGLATLDYVIPNSTKPGFYDMIGSTTNDVAWFQRSSSYIVNEPGACPSGMYKNMGICQKPGVDFCKSTSGAKCTFDYYRGSCSCISQGDCLIATASFGSAMAPEVQMLREIRDNQLMTTASGSSFMHFFNTYYYTFSPTIADWEREYPTFKEMTKIAITPLITSLTLLNHTKMDSEAKVLGYGTSLILLNIGMYFVAPAMIIHYVWKKRK